MKASQSGYERQEWSVRRKAGRKGSGKKMFAHVAFAGDQLPFPGLLRARVRISGLGDAHHLPPGLVSGREQLTGSREIPMLSVT